MNIIRGNKVVWENKRDFLGAGRVAQIEESELAESVIACGQAGSTIAEGQGMRISQELPCW